MLDIYFRRLVTLLVMQAVLCCGLAHAQSAPSKQDCVLRIKSPTSAGEKLLADDVIKSNPCATVPGLHAKSLSNVWSALLASSATGGLRFDTAPPPGAPTGKVLLSAQGVVFDLQSVFADGVISLQLSSDTAPGVKIVNPTTAVFAVPASRLQPGTAYDWVLVTRKTSYKASLTTPSAEELADLQQKLSTVDAAQLSAQMRLLYVAAIYDEAEFYMARNQILAQLHAQITP